MKALFVLLLLVPVAARAETEREVIADIAPNYGKDVQREVMLWDGSRCDLLNETYAIEVDWAPKWPEAVGQSLYYALATDRRPAIILLMRTRDDARYVYRCQAVCQSIKPKIRLFVVQRPVRAPPPNPSP